MDTGDRRDVEYVLGHSAQEFERLHTQSRLYEPFTLQFFRAAGIEAGMRVLDVGCGGGDVSFLVARLVGAAGQVVGIDRAPAAAEMASRRAQEMGLGNVRFLVADAGDAAIEGVFDAAVGRLVLQFVPDPSAVLRNVAAHVRPGGVIAFQEVDWSGCRALPPLPTYSRCLEWGIAAMQRSGADPYIGLKLYTAFTAAGLPPPELSVQAAIGAGPDHPAYAQVAGLMRTLLPTMEREGIVTPEELMIETLASRISNEAVAAGATLVWVSVVGAAARL